MSSHKIQWCSPAVVDHRSGQRDSYDQIVISPHPDDEVIALGGTLARARQENASVLGILVTDGRGSPRQEPVSDADMVKIRAREYEQGLAVLDIHDFICLNYRSSDLKSSPADALADLTAIFSQYPCQRVYLPNPFEQHATHRRVTALTLSALRRADARCALWGYEVWTSLMAFVPSAAVRHVDIQAFCEQKRQAIQSHRSQIDVRNYADGVLGRNMAHATFWHAHELQQNAALELFLDMSPLLENPDLALSDFCREIWAKALIDVEER